MLLDEMEGDIKSKEKFVVEQSNVIKNMQEVLSNLVEYKKVLHKAAEIIHP